jgi:beta-galactosidase/beta-glucuronidase
MGEEQQWFAPDLDEAGWADLAIAEFWEAQGYDYDGVAWYRVRLPIPAEAAGKPLLLYFGAADESAWVWCNGQPAGEHDVGEVGWDKRFAIDLTATARPGAENVLAVKVLDRTAMGGLWKNVKLVTNKD